jgi:3-hydroxyacyl-CoA dehydrogenase
MQNLTVLGTGVLGSQIAFQAAYQGKDVVAYDLSDEILAKLTARWEYLKPLYLRDLPDATLIRSTGQIIWSELAQQYSPS